MSCDKCDKWSYIKDYSLVCCWKATSIRGRVLTFTTIEALTEWSKANCDEPEANEQNSNL